MTLGTINDLAAVQAYAMHLLSLPGARVCCVVAPDGRLLAEWITTPARAAHNAEMDELDRGGNILVDSDGIVYATWGRKS